MTTRVAVDTDPRFEGLVIQASNLMVSAKAHRAANEPFDAAVAHVEAGNAFAQLSAKLLDEGFTEHGVRDLLNSAYCFLESGDYRLADRQLEKLQQQPDLRSVVDGRKALKEEYEGIIQCRDKRRRELETARKEIQKQAGNSLEPHRLTDRLLRKALSQMPGVADFHWLLARKHTYDSRTRQYDKPSKPAIDHYLWCVKLNPQRVGYSFVLVEQLLNAKRWDEATTWADRAVARIPGDPFILWIAGWARVWRVAAGNGSKTLLATAETHFSRAQGLGQFPEFETVVTICLIYFCQSRLGKKLEAKKYLTEAARDCHDSASDLAWMMLRAKSLKDQQRVIMQACQIAPKLSSWTANAPLAA